MSSKLSASRNATYEIGASQTRAPYGRQAARFIRLLPVILSVAAGGCQSAAFHGRQSFEPVLASDARQQPVRGGGARIRVGSYSVAGLRASVAERRWPLMQGYSVSHRYDFDLAADEGQLQGVRCVLLTISGDEERERRDLQCTVHGEDQWQVELTGRRELDGALVGSSRRYQVTRALPEVLMAESAPRAEYYVIADNAVVATVPANGSDEPWIAAELDKADRGAVAATVVALLVGRDLGRGGM